jgi:hypothetical protein
MNLSSSGFFSKFKPLKKNITLEAKRLKFLVFENVPCYLKRSVKQVEGDTLRQG